MKLKHLHDDLLRHAQCRITTLEEGRFVRRTFAELHDDVELALRRLDSAGIRARDRVGILSETRYEWLVHDLALARLDAVCVGIPEEDSVDCRSIMQDLD